MTTQQRREREKNQTRQTILDAARDLFAQLGYEGVSMRKVAQAVDYSPTAIYLHFADKEALFREICAHDFGELAEAFRQLVQIPNPADRLGACGRAYIEFAVAHPNHYRLMFLNPVPLPPTESDLERCGNPENDAYAFLRALVHQCREDGCFRTDLTDDDLIAQTLWAAVHGVAALEIAMPKDSSIDWKPLRDRADLALAALMNGMKRT